MKSLRICLLIFISLTFKFSSNAQCLIDGNRPKIYIGKKMSVVATTGPNMHALIEQAKMQSMFGLKVDFYIYEDSNQDLGIFSPNAYAKSIDGYDGEIGFGKLMLSKLVETGGEWRSTVSAIMAHEFGHVAQIKYGTSLKGRWKELQADVFAGYYLGRTVSAREGDKVYSIFSLFWEIGSSPFNEERTHGSKKERLIAAIHGFNLGSQDSQKSNKDINYRNILRLAEQIVIDKF